MGMKMDTGYQNGRNEFYPHEVKDIVYRINKFSDSSGKIKVCKLRIADTWAMCCLYSANKVNYRKPPVNKPEVNP
jgi:hypothetical protein